VVSRSSIQYVTKDGLTPGAWGQFAATAVPPFFFVSLVPFWTKTSVPGVSLAGRRVGMEKMKSDAELEKLFWEWTKRPEIEAKLYRNLHEGKIRRLSVHQLLGAVLPAEPAVLSDAANLI